MSHEAGETDEQRELLSHVFHLISQPMTAVQCSLEFALNAKDDPMQCLAWVECALENSERLRSQLALAREMAEADDGGSATQTVELRSVLEEALSELQPLLESRGVWPQLCCPPIEVAGERNRLLRALLYLLEQLSAAGDGSVPRETAIRVEREAESVVVRWLGFASPANCHAALAPQLEIARKTIEAVGGRLLLVDVPSSKEDVACEVILRAAVVQLDLYPDEALRRPVSGAIDKSAAFPQVS